MANKENENDAPQVYLLGKTHLANNQGQFFIRNDPIVNMAAGDRHTIIVTGSGRAFAFGDNSSGQLGLGHTNNVEKVSCIKSLKFGDTGEKVILAACGRESSLVATNRGSIYGFGSNSRSQLAIESEESTHIYSQPVKIDQFRGKMNWKQISMGAEHACALTDDGQVYVWGSNEDGQCGQPSKNNTIKIPRELRIEHPVVAISCGYYHTALVTENGHLFVFGNNDDRQLGRSIPDKFAGPMEVSFTDRVKAVACGHQHTVVLTEKGDVFACGHGDRGQLGLGPKVPSPESFEIVQGLPKRLTAIAAGEGHTVVIGARGDMYVFGDGKHGKLGSPTHSNEFEPCLVEKFKTFNVLKVVCGGCQTIVLAQKKITDQKKSSGSEEDIGNTTLSITQRPKSRARSIRNNKSLTDRMHTVGDSTDTTIQHVKSTGATNTYLRTERNHESDDEKSDKELSESLKSATFNQTHTLTNGRFLPTQSPSLNRTSLRTNDDDFKPIKTGVLDRTVRINQDTDDLTKTNNRFPPIEKSPIRNTRSDRTSPINVRKKQDFNDNKLSSEDEEEEEQRKQPPSTRSFNKKPEQPPSPRPFNKKLEQPPSPRNNRRNSRELTRKDNSDSDNNIRKHSTPIKAPMSETLNRKSPIKNIRRHNQSDDDEDDDEEEENERLSSRHIKQPPPTVVRRSSLPHQTRSGTSVPPVRDGNQTIGSKPIDGVRNSFRAPATKTLAKPTATNSSIDSTKKEIPAAQQQQPGFFSRLFGSKSTPPPAQPVTTTTIPAASTNSRTCSIM